MTSLASTILPHLPYMRRFARSLAGRQSGGDAYVAAVLEALIADPGMFYTDLPVRAALYKLLLKNWGSFSINSTPVPNQAAGMAAAADRRLEAIPPLPRQAFLLVTVEGFVASEAARILDVTPTTFAALLDEAGREIAAQVTTDILIIEDEPLIAIDLESIVTSIGHRVLNIARTKREAVAAFKAKRAGLVLADIQLADGSSGLDAVNEILAEAEMPVIFITAYPERLLTGLRPEPTFLIAKPFQADMVKAVVSQALFFETKARSARAGG